jgi:hypothetical protein
MLGFRGKSSTRKTRGTDNVGCRYGEHEARTLQPNQFERIILGKKGKSEQKDIDIRERQGDKQATVYMK